MPSFIPGKYQLMRSDKFEDFLRAWGVPEPRPGAYHHSVCVIRQTNQGAQGGDDGDWYMKLSFGPKTVESNFKFGVPFQDAFFDGRKCQSKITLENGNENKMIHVQTFEDNRNLNIVRVFTNNAMTVTMPHDQFVCSLAYMRDTS